MRKKYNTAEEKKAAQKAQHAKRYQENRDKILAQRAEHYKQNRDKILAKLAEYDSTPMGRAKYLLRNYRREDKKYNRGECNLDVGWIIENIFSKPCTHCGETDWHKLGCNRLDNSKPHTKDNVEP